MRAICLAALLVAGTAHAEGAFTGNEIGQGCAIVATPTNSPPDNLWQAGVCMGVMSTVIQIMDRGVFCTPQGANRQQYARVIMRYLNQHPERLHEPLWVLIVGALAESFPCPKK